MSLFQAGFGGKFIQKISRSGELRLPFLLVCLFLFGRTETEEAWQWLVCISG